MTEFNNLYKYMNEKQYFPFITFPYVLFNLCKQAKNEFPNVILYC